MTTAPQYTWHSRLRSGYVVWLAVAATSTAIFITVLAGWQRGGWLAERIAWVAIGVVLVASAHLLPALCRSASLGVRCAGSALWVVCMVATCFGHATFFLLSQQHAGAMRADAVTSPVTVTLVSSGRNPVVIAAERARVTTALAIANTRRCRDDCQAIRLSRISLTAKLDALNTEADESRRQQAIDDRRTDLVDRAAALRDAQRDDPVTVRLGVWLGTTATQVDLLSGMAFAGVLEGIACLFWFLAFQTRTPVVSTIVPLPTPPVTASNEAVTPSHAPTIETVTSHDDQNDSESEVAQLAHDIAAGRVRATVADIRRYLGCSQARAAALRRQFSASVRPGK
jgi:hypothetical protein